jgi:hypothetical protein
LLLCPDGNHYLWIGNVVPFSSYGIEVDDEDRPIMSRLLKWMSKVSSGEVISSEFVGNNFVLGDNIVVQRYCFETKSLLVLFLIECFVFVFSSGEESDEFWDALGEGF